MAFNTFNEDQEIYVITRDPNQVRSTDLKFNDVFTKATVVGFNQIKTTMFLKYPCGVVRPTEYGSPNHQPKPFSSAQGAKEWWNDEVDRLKDIQSGLHDSSMAVLERLKTEA